MYGLAFDSILNFLSDLAEAFPDSSAADYYKYVSQIRAADKKEQEKHVKLFGAFCIANRAELLESRLADFTMNKITYDDDEEPFNMHEIVEHKDFDDNSADILRHLLTISAIVDSESNAKQILASMQQSNLFQDASIVGLFGEITKDIEKKSAEDGQDPDPMTMITQITQGDAFKKLVNSIIAKTQNGEIDIGNLMSGMSSVGALIEGAKKK